MSRATIFGFFIVVFTFASAANASCVWGGYTTNGEFVTLACPDHRETSSFDLRPKILAYCARTYAFLDRAIQATTLSTEARKEMLVSNVTGVNRQAFAACLGAVIKHLSPEMKIAAQSTLNKIDR